MCVKVEHVNSDDDDDNDEDGLHACNLHGRVDRLELGESDLDQDL